jgi:hypothetical protein
MNGCLLVTGAVAAPLVFVGLGCSTLLGIGEGVYVPSADAALVPEATAGDASSAADSLFPCVFDDDASKFDPPPCTFGP